MKLELRFLLLLACFVLSGFAGLIYQTVWTQQFAHVFGTSEQALAMVLAAYMGGLALGAGLAARWAGRIRRPVRLYALLELGIGLGALAVPSMIAAASRLQVALLGREELPPAAASGSTLFYLVASFSILLIPTTLMGMTLPLLVRHAIQHPQQIGRRIAALYTANTAGAAAGTLVAAFLLLPRLGLGPTVWVAVGVNLAVFFLAVLLARGAPAMALTPNASGASETTHCWILPVILVSGTVSFTWEVLWTRLLGHLLGGSVYAFATMLATFLTGLALGSALAARWASHGERARQAFAVAQLATAGLSLGAFAAVDRLPEIARRLAESSSLLGSSVALSALTLLPAAIAIGATFPLAVRLLVQNAEATAQASARVFAWNTVGAIVGSLAAGYMILPALQFAGTAALAAGVSLILALITALASPARRLAAALAAAGLIAVAFSPQRTPWNVLRHSSLSSQQAPGAVVSYRVGRSANVLLLEQRLGWRLATNGLPESLITPPWVRPGRAFVTHWLTLLPFAARPQTRSLMIVGLGGGMTAEDVPPSADEVQVVELEPEVLDANRRVADLRRVDPLADPRLRLILNDARGALRLTERRFNAIVSQPSHPWTSGASHLFTREFLQLVRERLTDDGVFVQWMGLPFVDQALLQSFVATAVAVFPHVELYRPGPGAVLILASAAPLELDQTASQALAGSPRLWARLGILCPEDVLAARVLDAPGARRFSERGFVSSDWRNLFRTRAPKILDKPLRRAAIGRLLAPYDPLTAAVSAEVDAAEHGLYLVRRLIRQGDFGRARRLAEALPDVVLQRTGLGLVHLASGQEPRGELALREAVRLVADEAPRALEARAGLLLGRYRRAILNGQQVPIIERLEDEPSAAVVAGWQALGAGDMAGLARLEARLATIPVHHPLHAEAVRLRAQWRAASSQPEVAAEALDHLEPLLTPLAALPDLLLYARAALTAEAPMAALAVIEEALPRLPRGSQLAEQTGELLRAIPKSQQSDAWRDELRERLRRPQRQRRLEADR
ncbi:MAG: fused MFS/spermidine synthase [Acidobacteriota bacterium]